MSRKQKGLLWAALGFTILWVSLVLAVPSSSQAAGGTQIQSVMVVNTSASPVPVTGNVNVGTMPAVTVSSLPPVAVSSLPAVQLAAGSSVTVSNDLTNPVPIRDPELGRIPFQCQANFVMAVGQTNFSQIVYTVPGGKQLVLESAFFTSSIASGKPGVLAFLKSDAAVGDDALIPISLSKQGTFNTVDVYFGSITPKLRVPSGGVLKLMMQRDTDNSDVVGGLALIGYLVGP